MSTDDRGNEHPSVRQTRYIPGRYVVGINGCVGHYQSPSAGGAAIEAAQEVIQALDQEAGTVYAHVNGKAGSWYYRVEVSPSGATATRLTIEEYQARPPEEP